jgi:hypothetical protein
MEAPNPKHQIPNKSQSSKSLHPKLPLKGEGEGGGEFWLFEIGIRSLFGICNL